MKTTEEMLIDRMDQIKDSLYRKLADVFGEDWEKGSKVSCSICGEPTYAHEGKEPKCFMCRGREWFGENHEDDDTLDFTQSF